MTIRHSKGTYEIAFAKLEEASARLGSRSRIISDANVWPLYGRHFETFQHFVTPVGERAKEMGVLEQVWDWLADTGADRKHCVVALGGGVVGDLAGFAAATFMRGIEWVFLPTTLLSQVDSSIGGKTGVNLSAGKNLVGAFHAPSAVSICLETLATLPKREFLAGHAELWKHAAIADAGLFATLERASLEHDSPELKGIIQQGLRIKAAIVESDEFESGVREQLNFGHTVGHALEKLLGYGSMLHGEAVAIGMVLEARIGEYIRVTPSGVADRIESALGRVGLPTAMPDIDPQSLLDTMRTDKKARDHQLSMALLTDLGRCKLVCDLPVDDVLKCLASR